MPHEWHEDILLFQLTSAARRSCTLVKYHAEGVHTSVQLGRGAPLKCRHNFLKQKGGMKARSRAA